MTYPHVLSEDETIERALAGASLARFGDGELRLAIGGNCISQRETSKKMVAELKGMLAAATEGCLVCIPNVRSATPKAESWARYSDKRYTALYGKQAYGSSFVTRPDSAPWIDRPDYWDKVEQLWRGRDITLVVGDKKSLTSEMLAGEARSVREVFAPRQNAYAEIDRIEGEIGQPSGTVILCLGVTATVLAWRLAVRNVHAIDLGHIGMFMRHAGSYRYTANDLTSPEYRQQLQAQHKVSTWGADGGKHVNAVGAFADAIDAKTILDYGCGRGALAAGLAPLRRVSEYDPGIAGKEGMPKPVDLVVCTDVLEHVEPEKLDAVLDHLYRLTGKGAYIVIATRPANAILPDGRNAHLSVYPGTWWIDKVEERGFIIEDAYDKPGREVRLCLRR